MLKSILAAMLVLSVVTPASALRVCHISVKDPTALTPSLNMRVLPDPQSSIIGDLDNDQHVLIIETKGRWAYVYHDKLGRGWMAWQSARGISYIDRCFNWDGHSEIEQ